MTYPLKRDRILPSIRQPVRPYVQSSKLHRWFWRRLIVMGSTLNFTAWIYLDPCWFLLFIEPDFWKKKKARKICYQHRKMWLALQWMSIISREICKIGQNAFGIYASWKLDSAFWSTSLLLLRYVMKIQYFHIKSKMSVGIPLPFIVVCISFIIYPLFCNSDAYLRPNYFQNALLGECTILLTFSLTSYVLWINVHKST
jgi:hypothetical protein